MDVRLTKAAHTR